MQKDLEEKINQNVRFLVIGGGIAGVTCAETLATCCPKEDILLITESNMIKTITHLEPIARYLYKFDVQEYSLNKPNDDDTSNILTPAIHMVRDKLKHINVNERYVLTCAGRKIQYNYLCLCTGAQPRLISNENPLVLGIRDTDSVMKFQEHLKTATRVVLVGNGGIANELVYELKGVEIHWVIKDDHIAATFVDAGAAHFFQEYLKNGQSTKHENTKSVIKRLRYDELPMNSSANQNKRGPALGPDWHKHFELKSFTNNSDSQENKSRLVMHYKAEVLEVKNTENGALVTLTSGETIECDFVISATGVCPEQNFTCEPHLDLALDGGIKVNDMMQTSLPYIYAAGDVCTAAWQPSPHWFQMRLWTQARQMGLWAGRSIAAHFQSEQVYQDFCFELFGHVTQLFGFSVILLGRYNAQNLGTNYELLLRTTPNKEYIKFIIQNGRLRGAILIGNTELAETCENLILNGIDLTPYGDAILDPNIDIEDYFD